MSFNKQATFAGYYLITLRPSFQGVLLTTNNERAFVISHLQDTLTMAPLIEPQSASHTLAAHIDLLAFSILKEAVQLVVFAISSNSAESLAGSLAKNIQQYQDEWTSTSKTNPHHKMVTISLRKLAGQHDALQTSVQLHINHLDWEYDRYSSIGFYLHDRRGSWMRTWRLTYLYEANVDNYRSLCILALNNFKIEEIKESYLMA